MTHCDAQMNELCSYHRQARQLAYLGLEANHSTEAKKKASLAYAALKQNFVRRIKELEQPRSAFTPSVGELILIGAIKKGYLAMRASSRTSPRRRDWLASVNCLQDQMDHHLRLLEVEMSYRPLALAQNSDS